MNNIFNNSLGSVSNSRLKHILIVVICICIVIFIIDKFYFGFMDKYPYLGSNFNNKNIESENENENDNENENENENDNENKNENDNENENDNDNENDNENDNDNKLKKNYILSNKKKTPVEIVHFHINNLVYDYILIVDLNTEINLFEKCIETLSDNHLNGLILYLDESGFNNIKNVNNNVSKHINVNCNVEKFVPSLINKYVEHTRFIVVLGEVINNYKLAVNILLNNYNNIGMIKLFFIYENNTEITKSINLYYENNKCKNNESYSFKTILFNENNITEKIKYLLSIYKI